jgi:poly(hydroxyalkanoate) depolymerase family esterase
MLDNFAEGLRKATALTNAGRIAEATAEIQRFLNRQPHVMQDPAYGSAERTHIGGRARWTNIPAPTARAGAWQHQAVGLRARVPSGDAAPGTTSRLKPAAGVPDRALFLARNFTGDAGSRPYKLYVPSGYNVSKPIPLLVMLHGCTQTPDDFAVGTRMNDHAESKNCLVVYPEQTRSANMQKCWNWFNAPDQSRGVGEPSLIAGITRQVMRDYAVDPARVFVAGLSAGGAAAAIMGQAYPDLYAAIGIHSGLACGAARDMPSAFAAMKQGAAGRGPGLSLPAIVFHGDNDTTVNLRNGDAIVSQLAGIDPGKSCSQAGQVPGGRAYTRTTHATANGQIIAEQWVVRGAPHAWSGGCPSGSYTDPHGPDASAEMLRFFLAMPVCQ